MKNLNIENVDKSFGTTSVVEGFNLDVKQGEFISFLGPSGCGKTTMLRMIAGFERVNEGRIALGDQVISSPAGSVPPERRGMSMIFQSYAIWPNMTVFENVAFGLKVKKRPKQEIRDRVMEILQTVQLEHLADRYPAELSGGQQQRTALARAIVVQPRVLLLDEPLSNLDANLRDDMALEIRRLHDQFKTTTIYVTHDQNEAMSLSDRIVVMNKGRIEQIDTPWTLFNQPRSRFAASFIGKTNLLPCQVRDNRAILEHLQLDMGKAPSETSDGSRIFLSLRPEGIRLTENPMAGAGPSHQVEITSRRYLGDKWEYLLNLPGTDLTLKSHLTPLFRYQPGQKLFIDIDLDYVTFVN